MTVDIGSAFETGDQRWVVVEFLRGGPFTNSVLATSNARAGVTLCVFDANRLSPAPPTRADREIIDRYRVLRRRVPQLPTPPFMPSPPSTIDDPTGVWV